MDLPVTIEGLRKAVRYLDRADRRQAVVNFPRGARFSPWPTRIKLILLSVMLNDQCESLGPHTALTHCLGTVLASPNRMVFEDVVEAWIQICVAMGVPPEAQLAA